LYLQAIGSFGDDCDGGYLDDDDIRNPGADQTQHPLLGVKPNSKDR